MDLVNRQTGAVETVPDESVEGAFRSGSHAFVSPDQRVPIRTPDGEVGSVAAKDAQHALENGASIVSQDEFHKAFLEAQYGDVGHGLAAAGEGLARGLTVGLSEPIAIGAAKMFGGEDAAEKTRQHLLNTKEEHPYVAGGTEVLGAVLPTLLSDGAVAPEEAALLGGEKLAAEGVAKGAAKTAAEGLGAGATETAAATEGTRLGADGLGGTLPNVGPTRPPLVDPAAEIAEANAPLRPPPTAPPVPKPPSLVSQALQYTPAGLTSRLGLAAEHAAGEVLGATVGKSAIGRIAVAGARAAASAAVESPFYAAGNYLDESYLGNEDLNGEKFVAAVGHGFLYGTLFGAAAGTGQAVAGEAGGALLRAAKPYLEKEAGIQATKSVGLTAKQVRELVARTDGPAAVGTTWIREGVVPENPLEAGSLTLEQYKARSDQAVENKGKEIGDALRIHGANATVPVVDIAKELDAVIKPVEGKAGWGHVEKELKSYRSDLLDKLGIEMDPVAAEAKANRIANGTSFMPHSPKWREVYEQELATLTRKEVPFADLMRQRKALDDLIYRESSPLVGNAKLEELRHMRGKFGDLEISSIDRAARKVGLENGGAELKQLRREYQHLRIGEDAITGKYAREIKNNSASLTEHIAGAGGGVTGAILGLASGHAAAGAVIGGIALKYLRKAAREHGNVMAASALSRIANLDLIARATRAVDGDVDAAVGSITGRTKPRLRLRRFSGPDDKDTPEKKYQDSHERVSTYAAATDEHVESAIPGMSRGAPKTTSAMVRAVNTGVTYLKSKMPTPLNSPSIVDPNPKPRTDDVSAENYHQIRKAVEDPVGVICDGLETGKITRAQVQAVKDTKPAFFADVQRKLVEELAKPRKEQIPYSKLTAISLLFDVAADPTLDPAHVQLYQSAYPQTSASPGQTPGGGEGQAKPSSSPARLSGLKTFGQGASLSLDRASQAH